MRTFDFACRRTRSGHRRGLVRRSERPARGDAVPFRSAVLVGIVAAVLIVGYFVVRRFDHVSGHPDVGGRGALVVPGTFVIDGERMAAVKHHLGEAPYRGARAAVLRAGNQHLRDRLVSVTDKVQLPPSGDRHDYLSFGPYYWPNPGTSSGLPYVFRDGRVNPEFYAISDYASFQRLVDAVNSLAAAYYFTDEAVYSEKASLMLRTWFLDRATRMNPSMKYAGARKGVDRGAPEGIIELSRLAEIIDDVKILQASPNWSIRDQVGMTAWCARYVRWLRTSANGIAESASRQNHGTLYDLQAASLAEFLGEHAAARNAVLRGRARHCKTNPVRRLSTLRDGTNPAVELRHTQPKWADISGPNR